MSKHPVDVSHDILKGVSPPNLYRTIVIIWRGDNLKEIKYAINQCGRSYKIKNKGGVLELTRNDNSQWNGEKYKACIGDHVGTGCMGDLIILPENIANKPFKEAL